MYKIEFAPDAIEDLREIKSYISEELCNEQAAVNTVSKITKRIRSLQNFPNQGALLSSVADTQADYRFLVCDNYIE